MINMDFSKAVHVNTTECDWVASPKAGVWRKPLAREEAERGHATSLVRYEPGASFNSHNHPGGEEILVLEGTFSDETGDFGRGTYFRNPAGFVHAPFSKEGCLILVKLHQFDEVDKVRLSLDTLTQPWHRVAEGVEVMALHQHQKERVELVRLDVGAVMDLHPLSAIEGYLLEGEVEATGSESISELSEGSWWRVPRLQSITARQPTQMWLKSGHFSFC